MKELNSEKDMYRGELKKFNTYSDPSGPSLEQIRAKLKMEDPSAFRNMMEDLNYAGEEPLWEKMELFDRVGAKDGAGVDGEAGHEKKLKREVERLKKDRRDLASELQRAQDLLKSTVELDKHGNDMILIEIQQYNNNIQKYKVEYDKYNSLFR